MTVPAQDPLPTAGGRRERQRQATLAEIVSVSRGLLTDPGGLSLRAVAQRMGMTPPALYRYVASYADLVGLTVEAIDSSTAALLAQARDTQPEDDPVARLTCAALAFRRWALAHREEFSLVFTNPFTAPAGPEDLDQARAEHLRHQRTTAVFTDLLVQVWRRYRFPLPDLGSLDPSVRAAMEDPVLPVAAGDLPEPGLLWVLVQSWVALYGTVTIEVFGHCDPRLTASGALFRAMLATQADGLGLRAELPRLAPLIERELAR